MSVQIHLPEYHEAFEKSTAVPYERLTLVVGKRDARWTIERLLRLDDLAVAMDLLADPSLDIERLIIDRTFDAVDFLRTLTDLPSVVAADVLWIARDGSAFLSASARGDGRVVYALDRDQVQFYLGVHGLGDE